MESGAGEGSAADDYESLMSTTDAELLKNAWRNEKAAPEILKFDADLVSRSRQQIQLMEEMVDEFTKNGVDPLTMSLYQMDLDRTMFLLRSYLRTRLQKIETYVFHIEKTAELWNRLSKQEQKFTRRCSADLKHHLEQSVLSKLPDQYQLHLRQSAASEEDDMGELILKLLSCLRKDHTSARECFRLRLVLFSAFIRNAKKVLANFMLVPEPHLDAYVICRSKRFLGSFQLDDGVEEPINIEADDLYALPYKSIKPLVESGQIDLV